MKTVTIELTDTELTHIRVAMLLRLDRLKAADSEKYEAARALLNGKLWTAQLEISKDAGRKLAADYKAKHGWDGDCGGNVG